MGCWLYLEGCSKPVAAGGSVWGLDGVAVSISRAKSPLKTGMLW